MDTESRTTAREWKTIVKDLYQDYHGYERNLVEGGFNGDPTTFDNDQDAAVQAQVQKLKQANMLVDQARDMGVKTSEEQNRINMKLAGVKEKVIDSF